MVSSKKRVVVTGLGTVNPLGNNVEDTWKNACAGQSGIGQITKFDTEGYKTTIAGELKDFDPTLYVSAKECRRLDDFIIYALAASDMAIADSGLTIDDSNAERIGVILGSSIGGLSTMEKEKALLLNEGPRKTSPFAIPAVLANLAPGHVSIKYGLKGPISCAVTACAAANDAITDAFRTIACGYADVMISGGTDAAICPLTIAGFNAMRALSTRNDEPEKASRPFDKDRDGFIVSEGCGIVILEELSHALRRGAKIYAEIAGTGLTSDAFHMAAPPEGHEGAVRCMKVALQDAGMEPSDIDYINAHGTSTPLNDVYETEAIKKVFGSHSKTLAVSSTKSMTGHLLGAAGGIEAIFSVKAIQEGTIPPTINLDNPDIGCDLDYVSQGPIKRELRSVMSNAFGFGGVNSVLIFKKFEK
ncbi:MAG: beta-ketoacyl-ACP synthase II [Deltaproteobacteria bacterium]|nr:beta-ketoacyl-ACP synthase II [Deltaproteobacteria bacterium]